MKCFKIIHPRLSMKQLDIDVSPPASRINIIRSGIDLCSKSTVWYFLASYTCDSTLIKTVQNAKK